MSTYEQLKLENQLCFPFYAISRLITRQYQPHLDELGITYPQYLVLMVLWENDHQAVNTIAQKLILNTNTVTPLLKRMQKMGIITKSKSNKDERKMIVSLTPYGLLLKDKAAHIPSKLIGVDDFKPEQLEKMQKFQKQLLSFLKAMQEEKE